MSEHSDKVRKHGRFWRCRFFVEGSLVQENVGLHESQAGGISESEARAAARRLALEMQSKRGARHARPGGGKPIFERYIERLRDCTDSHLQNLKRYATCEH
jgi:hypothetical protein